MSSLSASKHSQESEERFLIEEPPSDIEKNVGRDDDKSRPTRQDPYWPSWRARSLLIDLWSLTLRVAIFLVPSFLQSRFRQDPKPRPPPRTPHPTAYLDGVRGLAALAVFFCPALPPPPLLHHLPHHHHPSSSSTTLAPFTQTLTSLIFRRSLRLFLPTFLSTLLILLLSRLGAYNSTRDFANDPTFLRNVREFHYTPLPLAPTATNTTTQNEDWAAIQNGTVAVSVALGEELWQWAEGMAVFVHPWDWMPFGADGDGSRRLFWGVVSVIGLYLMSQPDEGGADTPGWVYLTSLIPKWWDDEHRYWQSAGAMVFVLAVGRSVGWQRFFNLGWVQYFGRISYAIYLMHGPVLHTFGYATMRWAWGLTGIEGRAYVEGFALASVFVVPIVIWAADVFWRAVDAPVVRFARWVERQCSLPE
ncbi:hypothetical protein N0V88_000992 [Collariella sp. IMI 366227]|nr:hypothetical protein N0V88_000992 [Collariella sp. IMI 366227]